MKNVGKILLGLVVVIAVSAGVSYITISKSRVNAYNTSDLTGNGKVKLVNINAPSGIETDFTIAAENSVNAVVNIASKTTRSVGNQPVDIFEYFFGYRGQTPQQQQQQPQVGIGSGVIITPDGYIITNNHVIEGADEISVTLNDKKTYTAKVVGSDPNTDVALIKVDGKNLPTIPFGNSDDLKVGEWVLAVGNPMNLTSTVTAGIVSAKGRNLGIIGNEGYNQNPNKSNMSLESFIQTDAAVNPGNSGGALVNLRGELVGINTAIISQTGSYTGYSFAIPVNIVARVVGDIKQFGSFQRAYLGVSIRDIDSELAKDKNISILDGVYVMSVEDKSGALESGIKEGDVIIDVNGVKISKSSELLEQVSRYRPGDIVAIKAKRGDKILDFKVKLRNRQGGTETLKNAGVEVLGAAFGQLSDELKRQLDISYGVQITGLTDGKLKNAGIRKGYIILKINDQKVQSASDIENIIKDIQTGANFDERGVFIVGMYPNGKVSYYAIDLNE